MVANPTTAGTWVVEDDQLLDSAATSWAVLQAAALLPATTDTRETLDTARRSLQRQLDALGLDEDQLREHLQRQHSAPPDRGTGVPPDWGLRPSC